MTTVTTDPVPVVTPDPFTPAVRNRIRRIEALCSAVVPDTEQPIHVAMTFERSCVHGGPIVRAKLSGPLPEWICHPVNTFTHGHGDDTAEAALDQLYAAIRKKIDDALATAATAIDRVRAFDANYAMTEGVAS